MKYESFMNIFGVAWIGILCFVFAFVVSRVIDNFTPKLNKSKPRWKTFLEVCLQFGIVGAVVHGARTVIKVVPFPLDGVFGSKYSDLGELGTLPLLVFIFMFFQTKTQEKMRFLAE